MCKASHVTKKVANAVANSTLGISTIETHAGDDRTVGGFHALGQNIAQCVHCVQTGTKLTIGNIPRSIRKAFDLGKTEVATFLQHPQWHKDDQLVFDRTNATVDLKALADRNITVFVGVRTPDTKAVVDDIIAGAVLPEGGLDITREGWHAPAREPQHA